MSKTSQMSFLDCHEVVFKYVDIKVYCKSLMETFFLHLHVLTWGHKNITNAMESNLPKSGQEFMKIMECHLNRLYESYKALTSTQYTSQCPISL